MHRDHDVSHALPPSSVRALHPGATYFCVTFPDICPASRRCVNWVRVVSGDLKPHRCQRKGSVLRSLSTCVEFVSAEDIAANGFF
uniref:Uncharacterized protein n=1 Tax=Knipowitschia caucasica TaxID=637954 RepID=A0AAV2LST7_KNICA